MTLAWILFVIGFLAVLVTPVYYLTVAKPWRNPIGRLMLVQQAAFLLVYVRSLINLVIGHASLSTDGWSLAVSLMIDGLLVAIPIVHEYVRRKANRDRR